MANPENKQIPYESTQQDIRDAIESVATAIGGIAIPSADHVSYDNSVSGLSATDVQNALDEIVSDIPTVNNGILTIQQNGTSKGSFTANSASNVNVNIETPTADKKTATSEFNTANGGLLSKCMIDLEPMQDLHGYDSPWVGGSRKNKCPLTVDGIKSANTTVTWNGNSCIFEGVTITILTDEDNNVIGLKFLGTASHYFYFNVNSNFTIDGTYIISPLPQGAAYSNAFYGRLYYTDGTDTGFLSSEVTVTKQNAVGRMQIVVSTNVTVDFTYQPMLRLSTVTDPTFAPYSNICPISGHTEVDLLRDGKNLYDGLSEIGSWVKQRCTATFNGDGSITVTNTQSGSTWLGYIGTVGTTVNINNCPCSKGDSFIVTSGNDTVCSNISLGELDSNNILLKVTAITSGATYTVTEDDTTAIVLRYNLTLSNGATGTIYPMIRKSTETDSTFEPYLGHLYQVQIGSTVYGGYVDLVSGVMTITQIKFTKNTSTMNNTENYAGWKGSGVKAYIGADINGEITSTVSICKKGYANTTGSFDILFIRQDDVGKTQTELIALATDVEFVITLATPQTIQLTPQQIETLAGQNNLSTPLDGQSIETNGVEYKELFTFADVKEYVDKKLPDAPTTDGTYTLTATVSSGVATYSWT